MNNGTKEEISRGEIIRYVDILVKEHRFSYDRRIIPLLYEFFLRSAEKFNWDKERFLTKYINFKKFTKKIAFKELPEQTKGKVDHNKKAMYINKQYIQLLREKGEYDDFIDTFNHECLHKTDLCIRNGKLISQGLYKVKDETYISQIDTMLDEMANESATYIISSTKALNKTTMPFMLNTNGYQMESVAFSIMCSAFDISEIQVGQLKDKGREEFDKYLNDKYPYINIDKVLNVFATGINAIEKAGNYINNNIIDVACHVMYKRIMNAFLQTTDHEEFVERMTFDIFKMNVNVVFFDRESERISELGEVFKIYKKFVYNKDRYSVEEKEAILQGIREGYIDEVLINSKVAPNYQEKKYSLKEIMYKYYPQSDEPLNDNTQLIKQLEKNFAKPTIMEKI